MELNNWINNIHAFLYPATCVLCGDAGQPGMDLCGACDVELPRIETACQRCGIPLPAEHQQPICGQCLQSSPAYDTCISVFRYQAPVDDLITRLKFNSCLVNTRILGSLLADRLQPELVQLPGAILPVPLHASRLRKRGFNQALEIARPVARQLKLPLLTKTCERTRATAEQSTLPAKERKKNVKGVFRLEHDLEQSHIAIVDDVMTTGQTVNELAKVLRKAGVKRIDVWVCARAQLK